MPSVSWKGRISEMTVPGRYRSPGFMDVTLPGEPAVRRDVLLHSPFELRIGGEGACALDHEGSSAWAGHPGSCTRAGVERAIRAQLARALVPGDEVAEGARFAIEARLPESTDARSGEAGIAWAFLQASFTGVARTLSRALQARGFIEAVAGPHPVPGDVLEDAGIDRHVPPAASAGLGIGTRGMGAGYVLDGSDLPAAAPGPGGDMAVAAGSAGPGRHRGGSSLEPPAPGEGTPSRDGRAIGPARAFPASGLFGGYPGACGYVHTTAGAGLPWHAAGPVSRGGLRLPAMKGAPGLGDPLLRPPEAVARDVTEGHLLPRFAESVYAVSDRDAARRRRLERARPASEWRAEQRERVLAQDLIEPVRAMYAESMRLSPRWAAEYRGFWDLPEDFDFRAETPAVAAARCAPGRITPEEAADAFLDASRVDPSPPARPAARPLDRGTLAALLDERLPRREVEAIRLGSEDPGRFDAWVALLQERVAWGCPIVLPAGEGLYIVRRRTDGELVIRCHCGHDLCAYTRNWKMHAVVLVRDSEALLREVYPPAGHCHPDWQELREFICPACARLLEVEAVTPGYPVVHEFLPDVEGFFRGWLGREVPGRRRIPTMS